MAAFSMKSLIPMMLLFVSVQAQEFFFPLPPYYDSPSDIADLPPEQNDVIPADLVSSDFDEEITSLSPSPSPAPSPSSSSSPAPSPAEVPCPSPAPVPSKSPSSPVAYCKHKCAARCQNEKFSVLRKLCNKTCKGKCELAHYQLVFHCTVQCAKSMPSHFKSDPKKEAAYVYSCLKKCMKKY